MNDLAQFVSAITQPVKVPQVVLVEDLHESMEKLYRHGIPKGKRTGWSSLDEWYTVRKREWTLITGYPNHGKSCWLDNLLINLATREQWKVGIFSAENQPVEQHIASLLEIYLGQPFSDGPTPRMSKAQMKTGLEWLNEHFKFIKPDLPDRRLDKILEVGGYLVGKYAVDALVLDPWNELDHARPHHMREDEYISVSLSQLRDFTRATDVHFFVVAHPAKPKKDPNGSYPVPTMFDVKGAAEWNSKADNGIAVWRDLLRPEDGTDIHVQKVRFRAVGKAGGGCKLFYDRVTGRFTDPNNKPSIDDYMRERERKVEAGLNEPFSGQF